MVGAPHMQNRHTGATEETGFEAINDRIHFGGKYKMFGKHNILSDVRPF